MRETINTLQTTEVKTNLYGLKVFFVFILYCIADILPMLIRFFFFPKSLEYIHYVGIGQYIVNAVILHILTGRLSFCTIFLTLSFIFHQTHLILFLYFIDANALFDSYNVFPNHITTYASWFVIQTNCILFTGMLLGIRSKGLHTKTNNQIKVDYDAIADACKYLSFFGLIPLLYRHYLRYVVGIEHGYVATLDKSSVSNGFVITFSFFFYIAFCMWIKYSRNDDKKLINITMAFYLIVEFIYMSTGNRYEPIVSIIMIAYYYKNRFYPHVKLYQTITVSVISILAIQMLVYISSARVDSNIVDYSSLEFLSFRELFKAFTEEFGNSIYNVCQSVAFFPSSFSMSHFMKIGAIFLHIIPGLASMSETTVYLVNYVLYLPNNTNMGGSYIGELYFWCGAYGYFLALPIGFIVGYIENENENNGLLYIVLRTSFHLALLFILRGYLYENIRTIVWFSFVLLFLYNDICRRKKKR